MEEKPKPFSLNDGDNDLENGTLQDEGKASPVREATPQILASTAKNMLLLGLGMTVAFPTVVIGSLHKYTLSSGEVRNVTDPHGLYFDDHKAAWFGSLMLICQPVGSLLSGSVLEPLGRKRGMLAVNVPHFAGWVMFATATSVSSLIAASVMMGLSIGFMEAPIVTYVGEISTPKLRGALTSMAGISVMVGYFFEYTLGSVLPWRTVAAVSAALPLLTILAISMVPESPVWLVSRGRLRDAEKSLRWLRGWVPASAVRTELAEMVRHSKKTLAKVGNIETELSQLSQQVSPGVRDDTTINEKSPANNERQLTINGATDGVANNVEKPTLEDNNEANKASGNGVEDNGACNPGYVPDNQDGKEPHSQFKKSIKECHERLKPVKTFPPDPQTTPDAPAEVLIQAPANVKIKNVTIYQSIKTLRKQSTLKPLMLVISFFVLHHWTGLSGVRPYMVSVFEEFGLPLDAHWVTVLSAAVGITGNIICMLVVPWLGKRPLALVSIAGVACANLMLGTYMVLLQAGSIAASTWIPMALFLFFFSFCAFGIGPIPWMLLSEVFPFEGRGMATGIAAAAAYVLGFFAAESFLNLKRLLGLGGVFILYGIVACLGVVYMAIYLPETEGHSLQDIEAMYSKKSNLQKKMEEKNGNSNGAAIAENVTSKTAL